MKTTRMISIDADLNELAKVRRFKDPTFNFSELINNFLREFFGTEVENLERDKVEMELADAERKIALLKSQKQAIDTEEERKKKEYEKKYGVEFNPDET